MVVVVLAVAAGPVIFLESVAADSSTFALEFEKLKSAGSEDPQAWFELARDARAADELQLASEALAQAAEFGLGPVRLSLERARILLASDQQEAALVELQKLSATGFAAVGLLTSDPLINSLAGIDQYDELVRQMSVLAYPCAHQPGFQDFDFWIGEWEVHLANGTRAGSNVIKSIERGCALSEHWTNVSGGTGMSINYLDQASDEWVQVWNAEGGSQIIVRGGLTDEGMAMEGYISDVASGSTAPFRALWTPLPDGRVRQYFEQSNDGGATWVPWFEGFYTRNAQ